MGGGKSDMKDYFDVVDIFLQKRMTQGDADEYWKELKNNPALEWDKKGLNPKFPERVEWREEGFKEWFIEHAEEEVAERSSAKMKAAFSDEAFASLVAEQGLKRPAGGPAGSADT